MNPNRNTFLPHRPNHKPNTNNQSANIDRGTFINYNSVTKNTKVDKTEMQDKLITRIIAFAHKLQKQNQTKIISRQMLKNGSNKIFLDVIGIFLRSLDHKFQRGDVNSDVIIDILKAFGYPLNHNKTIFQPIGAPHTWGYCLAILEWFGQLADFTHNFEVEQQDESFNTMEKNILALNSYNDRNKQPLAAYIKQESNKMESQIEQYRFSIDSKKMAVNNLQNSQKDLVTLQKQIEKQKQLTYRIKQELYQLESQEKICDESIESLTNEVRQNNDKLSRLNVELTNIEYQRDHQELLPQQCERLKLQTQQTKNRILKMKEQILQRKNKFKTENKYILQKMVDTVSMINELKLQMSQNQLLQDQQLEMPNVNVNQLHGVLTQAQPNKESKVVGEIEIIEKIMQIQQFQNYLQRQQHFLNKFEQQNQNKRQQLKRKQDINYKESSQHEWNKGKLRQLQRALKSIQNRRAERERQVRTLQEQIQIINNNAGPQQSKFSDMRAYKKKLIDEYKAKSNEIKRIKNQTLGLDEEFQDIVANSRDSLERHEEQCLNKLNQHKEMMAKMNYELLQKYTSISNQLKETNPNAY